MVIKNRANWGRMTDIFMDKIIGVYLIINKINNRKYVGSSSNIYKRWRTHINNSKSVTSKYYDYPLYTDFRKYGINNFEFVILETCSDKDKIDLERHYYKSLSPEYNSRFPSDYEQTMDKDEHREACKKAWEERSFQEKDRIMQNLKLGPGGHPARQICAINEATGEKTIFPSLNEASKILNIPRSSISQILNPNHKRIRSKGYTFTTV